MKILYICLLELIFIIVTISLPGHVAFIRYFVDRVDIDGKWSDSENFLPCNNGHLHVGTFLRVWMIKLIFTICIDPTDWPVHLFQLSRQLSAVKISRLASNWTSLFAVKMFPVCKYIPQHKHFTLRHTRRAFNPLIRTAYCK